jgi:SAM-dependent methyltransferase
MDEQNEDRHLDLGCGDKPRNPYQRAMLYGVDIAPPRNRPDLTVCSANLSISPIPFAENHFKSVSAYDFFEHIPRIFPSVEAPGTRFPFIELMNEVWRVLQPNGLLYAMTPAYPHATAFQDPTHVNVLSDRSHLYFTEPTLLGRMYGFTGRFQIVRVMRVSPKFDYEPMEPDWRHRLRLTARALRRQNSHLIWEFRAVKTPAQ